MSLRYSFISFFSKCTLITISNWLFDVVILWCWSGGVVGCGCGVVVLVVCAGFFCGVGVEVVACVVGLMFCLCCWECLSNCYQRTWRIVRARSGSIRK